MKNTEIWNKARSLNLGIDFLNGLDELLTSLESEPKPLIIADVVKSLPNDEEVKAHIDTLPYYGTCTTEYNEGFEDGIKWQQD